MFSFNGFITGYILGIIICSINGNQQETPQKEEKINE